MDSNSKTCVPVCSGGCVNGSCAEPDECKCYEGYHMDPEGNSCILDCPEGCVNGNCSQSHTCTCDAGWEGVNCTMELSGCSLCKAENTHQYA
jgi:hypothetical protein